MESLENAMLREHKKLKKFLSETIENPSIENFLKLKWNLEKHFFVEEKIFYSVYSTCIDAECENLDALFKEHKEIIYLLDKIEEDLKEKKKPDFSELEILLKAHEKLEAEIFYPRLEESLDEEQKSLIRERARDIIIQ